MLLHCKQQRCISWNANSVHWLQSCNSICYDTWFASGLGDNKQVKLIGKLEQWYVVGQFTKCRFVYDANDGSKPVYFDVKLNFTGIDAEHAAGACYATLSGHTAITTSICTAQQSQLINPSIDGLHVVEFDIS